MTGVRRLTISATVALLLVAGAGCAGDDSDPPSAKPAQSSSSPLRSASSSAPTSDSEAAATAASSIVREYFVVVDQLRQRPQKPLRALASVATSSQLAAQRRLVRGERSRGLRQVGETNLQQLKVQAVNLDNSDPAAGKVPTVTVDVCWDVSRVDIVDASGKSVVSPDRPPTGWTRYTVANYHWSNNPSNGWRIATGQDLKQTPCAAS